MTRGTAWGLQRATYGLGKLYAVSEDCLRSVKALRRVTAVLPETDVGLVRRRRRRRFAPAPACAGLQLPIPGLALPLSSAKPIPRPACLGLP